MTTKEIYDRIVKLTSAIKKTGFARDLFDIAAVGNPKYVSGIIGAFRDAFPELNQELIDFGSDFNDLIGESAASKKEQLEMENRGLSFMFKILSEDLISKIYNALKEQDPFSIEDVITSFVKENKEYSHDFLVFQKKFNKVFDPGVSEKGELFGNEDYYFCFDPNIVDPLSLCALTILSSIDAHFLFDTYSTAWDYYIASINEAGYEELARFCCNTSWDSWIAKDLEEIASPIFTDVSELLVSIFNGKLKEYL